MPSSTAAPPDSRPAEHDGPSQEWPTIAYRWRDHKHPGRRRPHLKPRDTRARWDIQGLRAFAVLAVVANHVWGWPSGGFVGVDVFFVISGFLITGLLLREHDRTGRISWSGFYRRRIKRILPASLLVLVVTVTVSWFVFNAARWQTTAVDGVWALLFAANWRFALQSTDYFSVDRPVSPLQHYWSLGVEEQFYLVWPWLMLLVLVLLARSGLRVRPRVVVGVLVAALSAGSFVWALHETAVAANRAYFSTFSRAWELGLGALLAVAAPLVSRLPGALRPVLALIGLAGMVASLFVVDGADGFSAPVAALPVLSTALVIAAGTGVAQQRFLAPLTNRAAGYVGDISYSLYLWHFPVIILGRAVLGGGAWTGLLLVAIATVATVYTYHLLEDPLRRSSWLMPKARSGASRKVRRRHRGEPVASPAYQRTAASLLALVTVVMIAFALQPRASAPATTVAVPALPTASTGTGTGTSSSADAAQDQLSSEITTALGATRWPTLSPSMDSVIGGPLGPDDIHACGLADTVDEATCTWGDPKAERTVMVVGNSVAVVYVDLLHKALGDSSGWKIMSYAQYGCGFRDMSITPPPADALKSCAQRPDQAVAAINRVEPDVLVVSGGTGSVEAAESELRKLTVKPKIVMLPGPPADKDVTDCYSKVSSPQDCVTAVDAGYGSAESKIAADFGGVFIDPRRWYCVDDRCPAFVGSTPVKLDRFHLTTAYDSLIAPVVRATLVEREVVTL